MKKSQQCTVCHGMFESSQGKHLQHQKGFNTTPKGTPQEWVCKGCLKAQDKKVKGKGKANGKSV